MPEPIKDNNTNKERPRIKPPEIHPRPLHPSKPFGGGGPRQSNDRPMSGNQRHERRPGAMPHGSGPVQSRPAHSTQNNIPRPPQQGTSRPSQPGSGQSRPAGAGRRPMRAPRFHDRPRTNPERGDHLDIATARKFGRTANGGPHVSHPAEHGAGNTDAVRLIPLGGLEEVGRNCSFLEYKNEIVIIDAGLQFPEEETPGIDYIIPNTTYLEKKKENVHAIILTHGHYDHIGALPYMVQKLGNPPIYATSITKAIVERRQEDFPNAPKLNVITIKNGDEVKLSNNFTAYFFGVPHTIPETTGVLLKTPAGNICHFADFRVDYNEKGEPQGLDEFERIGKMGVHTFMVDSTNAEKAGHSPSEKTVEKNLEEIFRAAEGRIIVATFSSLITRIAEIIKIAEKIGRKVALNGYSMKTNIQIAEQLGFVKAKEGTIISVEDIARLKDDKVLILSTGAQGESNAGLMKIINGEHRVIKIKPGDTMILSSSVIPGNERSVQAVKDNLSRQGATVFHSGLIDIHSSGHAPKEDLKLVMKLIKPKFLMPIHGYYFMRASNGISAREVGIPKENVILMDNGQVAELTKDTFVITKEDRARVLRDGRRSRRWRRRRGRATRPSGAFTGRHDRHHSRHRPRQRHALIKNPDIISRGFIYLKENQDSWKRCANTSAASSRACP